LREDELEKDLGNFMIALADSQIISAKSFTGGVSKFAQMVSGLAADVPHLCKLLARSVMMPLAAKNYLNIQEIKWVVDKAK
jgi:hypothetical protein